jgi:hypothetical protein
MFEFIVDKDLRERKKKDIMKEVAVGKITTHLCLTLIIKKSKISVEHGRVTTPLNIIKY